MDDLLNRPSEFNLELVESIPTKPVEEALGEEITAQEVEEAVQKLNSGKSPDMNCLLAEFFHCAGPVFMGRLTTLLQTAWKTETIPEDWRNSLLVVLYKEKGPKKIAATTEESHFYQLWVKFLVALFSKELTFTLPIMFCQNSSVGIEVVEGQLI